MRKKYYYWILLAILSGNNSCEKDDFCTELITPKLTLRFYDIDNTTTLKASENMYIWAIDKDSLYKDTALDSLSLPLRLSDVTTRYVIENKSIRDTIEFLYAPHDVFVSRSCGYKTVFEDLQVQSVTNNWIKDIEIVNATIENDTAAHIRIFH
jgi:hypothetical protein